MPVEQLQQIEVGASMRQAKNQIFACQQNPEITHSLGINDCFTEIRIQPWGNLHPKD